MSRKTLLEGLKRATRNKCYGIARISYENEELFGDKETHDLHFYVYDGFAYCPNYNGKVYMIKDLPRLEYFKTYREEADDILKEFGVKYVSEMTPFMIIKYYGHITCEGEAYEEDLNIDYDEEDRLLELEEEKAKNISNKTEKAIELI